MYANVPCGKMSTLITFWNSKPLKSKKGGGRFCRGFVRKWGRRGSSNANRKKVIFFQKGGHSTSLPMLMSHVLVTYLPTCPMLMLCIVYVPCHYIFQANTVITNAHVSLFNLRNACVAL